MTTVNVEAGLRTNAEKVEAQLIKECFEKNPEPWEKKLENFPKYVRRQNLTRFLALYEIFKRVQPVKGSIIECGVFRGFGTMTWAKLSAILEPVNLTRRIYGFDSFAGFPAVSEKDLNNFSAHVKRGDLYADSQEEILKLAEINDSTRFLGHIPKVKLIKGDATQTIPKFIEEHPHLLVSLLFLDFDLYEPTKVALEHFLPRMPKGAVIAFDELDNPLWPGETMAMLEATAQKKLRIERLDFDPYIGFAVID
ncbi:MAG: dTDP-6-deoxy-L-hexose 3-O-methyltransferase [Bdellovibrio sp. ArHS]|uniref:TylF/MycF/NovP-related O-methyltransferase n=1 Tax=Bdellovibrio sp. ArHS TaxID=1569284 RepID=UPI00058399EA|nr:TylF/MycF/NovP-related O-methyltransferase [Bdellovibrio sp. ArHS]KHD90002.1 MAG: dTDP-6-deoxy-L-hexose 3-O-methyltransferase [Bdellovibrio sp. ArHS]